MRVGGGGCGWLLLLLLMNVVVGDYLGSLVAIPKEYQIEVRDLFVDGVIKDHWILPHYLLERGLDPNVMFLNDGRSCTTELIAKGANEQQLLKAEENGVNLFVSDSLGRNPLHIASFVGSCELLPFFFARGISQNARDREKHTPLHYAAASCNEKCVEFLLHLPGVKVNATNSRGQTPLHLANNCPDSFWSVFLSPISLPLSKQHGRKTNNGIGGVGGRGGFENMGNMGGEEVVGLGFEIDFGPDGPPKKKKTRNGGGVDVGGEENMGGEEVVGLGVEIEKNEGFGGEKIVNSGLEMDIGVPKIETTMGMMKPNSNNNDLNNLNNNDNNNNYLPISRNDFLTQDEDGNTPLHYISAKGDKELVKRLLEGQYIPFEGLKLKNVGNLFPSSLAFASGYSCVSFLLDPFRVGGEQQQQGQGEGIASFSMVDIFNLVMLRMCKVDFGERLAIGVWIVSNKIDGREVMKGEYEYFSSLYLDDEMKVKRDDLRGEVVEFLEVLREKEGFEKVLGSPCVFCEGK